MTILITAVWVIGIMGAVTFASQSDDNIASRAAYIGQCSSTSVCGANVESSESCISFCNNICVQEDCKAQCMSKDFKARTNKASICELLCNSC